MSPPQVRTSSYAYDLYPLGPMNNQGKCARQLEVTWFQEQEQNMQQSLCLGLVLIGQTSPNGEIFSSLKRYVAS